MLGTSVCSPARYFASHNCAGLQLPYKPKLTTRLCRRPPKSGEQVIRAGSLSLGLRPQPPPRSVLRAPIADPSIAPSLQTALPWHGDADLLRIKCELLTRDTSRQRLHASAGAFGSALGIDLFHLDRIINERRSESRNVFSSCEALVRIERMSVAAGS